MTTILVTGATGCVGANIVEALLKRGYTVRALRRASSSLRALAGLEPELVTGDVLDLPSLCAALEGCDGVFHAAAISQYWRNEPATIYAVNVEGTRNVLRAAQETGVRRIVFTSSVGALGQPARQGALLDETAAFNLPPARFPYGHSKALAEAEVQQAIAGGLLEAIIVNPATVIGRRDVGFVGGEFLRTARQGKAVAAPPGGVGIISASAVGRGHVLAYERGRSGERYILSGENVLYRQLMRTVAEVVGVRPPAFVIPAPALALAAGVVDVLRRLRGAPLLVEGNQMRLSTRRLFYDTSKAERELGLTPVSARSAVEEAWAWYQAEGLL
jgi:dihydroflavonol-4-reductase